ncbi:HlyD family efflux transporter periplasmic adaptor subunit [Telluria mixta]|uniref:HlyD family efflux transporter periplasmic adaptor subunit n=1 Tax=Telluria mixta TaxID=34071 RepID=A0ABT2C1E8_9BURK|nr:HlyD family efflux transporter periplasmic adaptor subunit [Telluria mixta]MCS0631194.1 HlyD family efflux transporter periplasmic adaptor subunit [Telluria mixta]WEM95733.1 HlyD family efflux transporter periplasmic adaptor subunit [Telluria mixta]
MNKKIVGIAVLAVVVVAAVAVWWARSHRRHDDALVFQGNVDLRQVTLAFDGSGRVAELRADEGQRVAAGTVLAVLDTQTLRLELDQARAQAAAQQQVVQRLRNGARPEEVAQARSRLAAAEADAGRAGRDLARQREIAANTQGRGVSAQELDHAADTARGANARVDEMRAALRLVERGARAEDVAGAEAQWKAALAQVAVLEHQIGQGELKSPVDAVVRARLLEAGDMATPQRPVFTLALDRPKWVRIYAGEPDLARIRPGMAARVRTDGHPAPLAGHVGYISSVAEFTPKSVQTEELRSSLVYEVRVLVDDPADVLRLGQPASVQLANGATP